MIENQKQPSRRSVTKWMGIAGTAMFCGNRSVAGALNADLATLGPENFQPKYILASSMYGYKKLADILPEVKKTGATAIDIWPKVHGNQREQMTDLGEADSLELLKRHGVRLGCLTQYPLGPFRLSTEMEYAKRFDCRTIVCGGSGPKGLKGDQLKKAVKAFVEKMKPHTEKAKSLGITIAIENHGNNLIESPDSLKWLVEFGPENLGVGLAPYHLPQDEAALAELIKTLGNRIEMFYAWQHGKGCMKKLPKEEELLQMPGRGALDFAPILEALQSIQYRNWFEIFMHPVPRGIPILPTVAEVTSEINRSREYLEKKLKSIS